MFIRNQSTKCGYHSYTQLKTRQNVFVALLIFNFPPKKQIIILGYRLLCSLLELNMMHLPIIATFVIGPMISYFYFPNLLPVAGLLPLACACEGMKSVSFDARKICLLFDVGLIILPPPPPFPTPFFLIIP